MALFPASFIDDLKSHADLVQVVHAVADWADGDGPSPAE